MKSSIKLFAVILMLSFSVHGALAANRNASFEYLTTEQKAMHIEQITKRVKEIKSMDKSQLSPVERKSLRNELRSMQKQARDIGSGGIILTVGSLLVVILLLILLL